MKKTLLFIPLMLASATYAQDWYLPTPLYAPLVNDPAYKPGWELIYRDEFRNHAFDSNFWNLRDGCVPCGGSAGDSYVRSSAIC